MSSRSPLPITLGPRVRQALDQGDPILAFESTIFSDLGLPMPHNLEALDRCFDAAESIGVTPALTAVLDGVAHAGVERSDAAIICGPAKKAAARDLSVAIGQGWNYGATTVSGSLEICAAAGIEVFATGGIGGVHRGWAETGDISADLEALARHQVITVSAGAKVFLDLAATLERLESDSVPVLGWRCDEFPAFHATSSGLPVTHRVDSAEEVARIARANWGMGRGGILVVAPVPEDSAIPLVELENAVDKALDAATASGVTGNAITPVVLAALAEATDGQSIPTNLALAENNAMVGAEIAVALSARR